jgi:hypothetical protein
MGESFFILGAIVPRWSSGSLSDCSQLLEKIEEILFLAGGNCSMGAIVLEELLTCPTRLLVTRLRVSGTQVDPPPPQS